ncbi:MAG: hypothetical protein DMF74_04425 [Acidobacteria bacterium]|nr:MAG: hypothetical protein DMF74_04425 [Acidobacteriota bacterium]
MSILLFVSALTITFVAARRSLVMGLGAVLAFGYIYGITRANLPDPYSHFLFDAAVLGFYTAQLFRRMALAEEYRIKSIKPWMELLVAWPILMFMIPNQDFFVRLLGLRANILLLPFMIVGARLSDKEKYDLAMLLAILNLGVFVIAIAEFFVGVESFFPRNGLTDLVYLSKDVAGYSAYRIPSTFIGSHAYAGTMVMSLPFLIGALHQANKRVLHKSLVITALIGSLLGVLLAASRSHFIGAAVVIMVAMFSVGSRRGNFIGWVLILATVAWLVSGEQRLQRFTQLQDTEMITQRIVGSVNMGFFELAGTFPLGNGLGAGTHIPYFLSANIQNPVATENEFGRMVLELGLVGLGLWLAFIGWLLIQPGPSRSDPWFIGRRLAWVTCLVYFAFNLLGTGLLVSIPQTCLLLLNVGWVAARQSAQGNESVLWEQNNVMARVPRFRPSAVKVGRI